jgi:hypothetical protein
LSSEAEYVSISEALKNIKFIYYLLREIGIDIDVPIKIRKDNVDAIFMAKNECLVRTYPNCLTIANFPNTRF